MLRSKISGGNLVREPSANLWDGDARVKIASEPLTMNVRASKQTSRVGWLFQVIFRRTKVAQQL
jgi:hypothetical protein